MPYIKRYPQTRECGHCGKRLPVGLALTNHVRAHERRIIGAWLDETQPQEGELFIMGAQRTRVRYVGVVGMEKGDRWRNPAVLTVRELLYVGGTAPVASASLSRDEWRRRSSENYVGANGEWPTLTRVYEEVRFGPESACRHGVANGQDCEDCEDARRFAERVR